MREVAEEGDKEKRRLDIITLIIKAVSGLVSLDERDKNGQTK